MSEEERDPIVALDYTPIVKHRGKLFTVGDLSLSKFGGVDLSAAAVAAIPALITGSLLVVVLFFLSPAVFWAVIPAAAVWAGCYLWFSREVLDAQSPQDRILLYLSSRRTQPRLIVSANTPGPAGVGLAGQARQRARASAPAKVLAGQFGTRHPVEDRNPVRLQWTVILKRPADPEHLDVGAPLRGRGKYRPRPHAASHDLADDRDQFEDWYAYLRNQPSAGTGKRET